VGENFRLLTMKNIVILGATGSIGASTLAVLAVHADTLTILGLSAHSRMAELAHLVVRYRPQYIAVPDAVAAAEFNVAILALIHLHQQAPRVNAAFVMPVILLGEQGLCDLASLPQATHVVAAIVGAAGLPSALAAANAGKTILLANKEALVMAGSFFLDAVRVGGASLLPLDSEHNALFQCLPAGKGHVNRAVRSVWLTASGGPFLSRSSDTFHAVTPEEACKHPKWSMGRKISVDSATLMNKGLEVIEAALMYGLPSERVKVVIHPQSMIHALVQYVDGSVLAHLSHPDMRVPIAHALAYDAQDSGARIESGVQDLDMQQLASLQFSAPDTERFPCLALAYQALEMGQHACIALNAANEIAVAQFLANKIAFTAIASVVKEVLKAFSLLLPPKSLDEVYALDAQARTLAHTCVTQLMLALPSQSRRLS
jgi:1-deoxy-D-xylulose-5-phosphate reductoisomerase